jgi:hypothetical protein
MTISRSPLRTSLGGAGTDLTSNYKRARRLPPGRGDRHSSVTGNERICGTRAATWGPGHQTRARAATTGGSRR